MVASSPVRMEPTGLPVRSSSSIRVIWASPLPKRVPCPSLTFLAPWVISEYLSMTSGAAPTSLSRPWSSQATSSQKVRIWARPWETTTTVRPSSRNSANLSMQRSWNSMSPTARTSSTRRISGSTWMDTEKPRRTYMPEE